MDNAKRKRGRPKATEVYKRKRIKAFVSTRVYLGTQYDRWTALKMELRLNTDRDLAQLLIDSYLTHKGDDTPHHAVGYPLTSSPVSEEFVDVVNTPSVSEVFAAELHEPIFMTHKGDDTPHHAVGYQLTSSPVSEEFVDVVNTPSVSEVFAAEINEPSDISVSMFGDDVLFLSDKAPPRLSIDVTITDQENFDEDDDDDDDDDDPEYKPRILLSGIIPENIQTCPDATFQEAFFGEQDVDEADLNDNEEVEDRQPEENTYQYRHEKIVTEEDINVLCSTSTCIVFLDQLLELAEMSISSCSKCSTRELEVRDSLKVSSVFLEWECTTRHLILTRPGSAISRASAPGTRGPGFAPRPRHTEVLNNGSGIAPLLKLKQ